MEIDVHDIGLEESPAELTCIGLFDGEVLEPSLAAAPGADEVRETFKKLTLLRPEHPGPVLVVGLGDRTSFDAGRARTAAALAVKQARTRARASIAWVVPDVADGEAVCAGLVEGTVLASWRLERFKPDDEAPRLGSLTLITNRPLDGAARQANVIATAQNRARELQQLPANVATPSYLADRACEIAADQERVSAEVLDRSEFVALGMGGLAAVSQGSVDEPKLIVLRYDGEDTSDERLALVGKAVTFDTGGISLKPSARMFEMKMDMSGGAAVLEAVAAIAALRMRVNILAVVPATDNMPSGQSIRPGDVITHFDGTTVEVNNTDAEGRLILADALAWAVRQPGVAAAVDIATLTGAVLVALGSTHAGLISTDDELAASVEQAGSDTGELVWRLPLHENFAEQIKGTTAQLTNAGTKRKAGTIWAGAFLRHFVGDTPWAHLDIAGTAWDTGRPEVGSGPSGFGVRLLVELARTRAGG
ncbi:MAG: leucyl aminopeptidase family protein [Solirubrobacterales bacterium]